MTYQRNNRQLALLPSAAAACITGISAAVGPHITFTIVADHTTKVRALGLRPSLHDGYVSFGGRTDDSYPVDWVLAVRSGSGSGPFTILADDSTPIPDVPGETYSDAFQETVTHAGSVAFIGNAIGVPPPSLYLVDAEGGPIKPIGPPMVWLTMNEAGVAGNAGVSDLPVFNPSDGEAFSLVGLDTPPGGGSWSSSLGNWTGPALGGDTIVFPFRISGLPGDGGLYSYDIASHEVELVANSNTPMPGQQENFNYFRHCDTEGERIVFTGEHGSLGFGGVDGVFVVPVGMSGEGPFLPIAFTGDPMPESTETFWAFGTVALDEDLVLFTARSEVTLQGLYGSFLQNGVPGPPFKVLATGDMLEGKTVMGVEIHPHGLDGNQIVFRITYDATCPPLTPCTAYYVATIALPVPADLDGDGRVGFSDVLILLANWGPCPPPPTECLADLDGDGSVGFGDLLILLASWT